MKWQSSQYSESDINRMQKDAVQRTREMQKRAREAAAQFNRDFAQNNTHIKHQIPPQINADTARSTHNEHTEVSQNQSPLPLQKIVSALGLDHEKIVLIGLMLILLNDGGLNNPKTQKLLMALAYLLFF